MTRWWLNFGLLVAFSLGTGRLLLLELRLARVEERPGADPVEVRELQGELRRVQAELSTTEGELRSLRVDADQTRVLDEEVENLRGDLISATALLEDQECRLELWDGLRNQIGPRALDARVEALRAVIEDRWGDVQTLAASAEGLARTNSAQLVQIETALVRDTDHMWRTLVGPVVQLSGDSTVGSGVLLPCEALPGVDGAWGVWLLTSWHVVRDIQADARDVDAPVPVTIYAEDATVRHETAELVAFDARLDAALLKLVVDEPIEWGATLMPRDELARVRVFAPIYAVGCPLGNDPIPTYGEVADTRHVVDGERYWMISAPTYVGNSGGGIFDARSHRLIGLFSKIYTHGTLRPTVVPHMGLVTPLESIYDWLHSIGHGELEPVSERMTAEAAAPTSR